VRNWSLGICLPSDPFKVLVALRGTATLFYLLFLLQNITLVKMECIGENFLFSKNTHFYVAAALVFIF
jgi:hypothetical protein